MNGNIFRDAENENGGMLARQTVGATKRTQTGKIRRKGERV